MFLSKNSLPSPKLLLMALLCGMACTTKGFSGEVSTGEGFTIDASEPAIQLQPLGETVSGSIKPSGAVPQASTDRVTTERPANHESHDDLFLKGVQLYRQGSYSKAYKVFCQLTQLAPQHVQALYYLAITEAQLGRVEPARIHYQEVIRLTPHLPVAALAKEGLTYLPTADKLDLPPKFETSQYQNSPTPHAGKDNTDKAGQQQQENSDTQRAKSLPSSGELPLAPQGWTTAQMPAGSQSMMNNDWQALQQMMMGGNGSNSNRSGGGMESLMPLMLPQAGSTASGSSINPAALSQMMNTMMMNQLFNTSDDNH
jgi:hypothetical protein